MAGQRAAGPDPADGPVAARRRMAEDLAPYLVMVRDLTDPSGLVASAAGGPVRFGVALEPLRGPVLRALGRAWHCASAPGAARSIEVHPLDGTAMLVQVHGTDWSLLARTGGPALCLFDGEPPAVVDVSGTDLIGPLVQALVRAAGGPAEPAAPARPPRGSHAMGFPVPGRHAGQDHLVGSGSAFGPAGSTRRSRGAL